MWKLQAGSWALLQALAANALAATSLQTDYYESLALQRTREILFETFPQWALGVNLVAAAILFFVWKSQRKVSHFDCLVGACLTGNVVNLNALYPALFPALVVDLLLSVWLYFLLRILFNTLSTSEQRWLTGFVVGILVTLGFAFELGGANARSVVLALAFCALTGFAAKQLYQHVRVTPSPKISLLLGVFILGLSGVVDNTAYVLDWHLPQHPDQQLLLVPLAQIIAVILALYFLVTRHANNQIQLAALNATLDYRVREAERELEDRYRLLTQDALNTAALRERRNIYQSIHEDLSDKLLQLVYRAPTPATADLARAALAELRDSQKLQPNQQRPLIHILADAFAEVQSRFDLAGVNLTWQVATEVEYINLNARQESALTRTLREAVSNLLKHAQARHVAISFTMNTTSPSELHYSVTDDGVGIDPGRPSGRGLINMRQRIEELGGSVVFISTPSSGTAVNFYLPISGDYS